MKTLKYILLTLTIFLNSCSNDEETTDNEKDIYICGYERIGNYNVAKYWKNGVPVQLTDGTRDAETVAITGKENDIYVLGYEMNDEDNRVIKYWKNGVGTSITDGNSPVWAYSMTVAGNDVYIAGYEHNDKNYSVAKYWKNGVAITLTSGKRNAEATAIAV